MSKIIQTYNIRYDTDGLKVKLPRKLVFEVSDDVDPEYEMADFISDKTGWCVNSFSWKELDKNHPDASNPIIKTNDAKVT